MSEKNMKQPGKMAGLLVQIKKIFGLNIATVAFGILLIYMLFTAVLFLTSSHIESYQVSSGPLSRNPVISIIMQGRAARSMPEALSTDSVLGKSRNLRQP